ncbi:MAG: GIY-YIG nuclease family protein [Alphaproteobacteria bacterium]|nr:GIY-YIG nuclease family protein [Alphaproteobacteria bacterium]
MLNSYVYILASQKNGTLYIGATSDLIKRIWQHKTGFYSGFTKKYNVKLLVYYEIFSDIKEAIHREKVLKGWKRNKKIALIEQTNQEWEDLYEKLL